MHTFCTAQSPINIEDMNNDRKSVEEAYALSRDHVLLLRGSKEEPAEFFDQEEFEWKQKENRFAIKHYRPLLVSPEHTKRVEVQVKRFKQKMR
jgi:hypothetical protein